MAKITKYIISNWQAKKEVFLVKSFHKLEYGKLKKGQAGIIFDGEAITADVDLAGLAAGISRLDNRSCIGLGNCGKDLVKVTTAKNDGKKGKVARTKDNFKYTRGEPAFLYFDMDHVSESPEEAISILEEVVPDLSGAGKLIVYSSSAGIKDAETGALLSKSTSAHIYIEIKDGNDAVRFLDTVFDRLALLGHGHIELSAAPSFLRRGIIDQAVSGPERLIYEGSPILGEGLTQDRPEPQLIEGGSVDTSKTLSLDQEEQEQLRTVWQELKEAKAPELVQASSDKANRISKERKIPFAEAEKFVTANQKEYLEDSMPLFFKEHGEQTVAHVLENHDTYNNAQLADPLDPNYDGGSMTKAKFFWNNGEPKIYSQAHGGISYTFLQGKELEEVEEEELPMDEVDIAIAKMNENHACCFVGSSFVIIHEYHDALTSGTSVNLLKVNDFYNYYKNQRVFLPSGDGQLKPHDVTKLWMSDVNRRSYMRLAFDPSGNSPDDIYNLYRGFNRIKPVEGDWNLFRDLIFDIMCSGRQEMFDYAMAWFQNALKNPANKSGVAMVMHGQQGCGKGTVVDWLKEIFAAYYAHLTDGNQLVGNFNKQLFGKLLVFADEAMFVGDKRTTDKMKGLITESTIQIEYKGVDSFTAPNYMNIMIASNNDHVVDASTTERRYAVFNFSRERMQDRTYFGELRRQMNNGGLEALCHHLMTTTDYDHVDVHVAPVNEEMRQQKSSSLEDVPAFWEYILNRGYILTPPRNSGSEDFRIDWINSMQTAAHETCEFMYGEWEEGLPIPMSYIYEEYVAYCKLVSIRFPKNGRSFWRQSIGKNMESVFDKFYLRAKKRNIICFLAGGLDEMRANFDSNVAVMNWDEGCDDFGDDAPF